MPVPKRKNSRSRRDKRWANKGLESNGFPSCKTCGLPVQPHCVCSACGHYKGEKVIRTKLERAYDRGKLKQVIAEKKGELSSSAASSETVPEVIEEPKE